LAFDFVAACSGSSNRATVASGFAFVVVVDLDFVVAVVAAGLNWARLPSSLNLGSLVGRGFSHDINSKQRGRLQPLKYRFYGRHSDSLVITKSRSVFFSPATPEFLAPH
jgi:hypothetical protein